MRFSYRIGAAALAALLLTTSASTQGVGGAAPVAVAGASDDYQLDSGDRLRITVYNEPALSGFFNITASGSLSYPLIGDVAAKNMTTRQLEQTIHDRLANGNYVKNAQVSAELVSYRPYYILGEVNRPGSYPYVAGMKLQQAIAAAGGYTYRANRGSAFIQHPDKATEERVKLKGEAVPIKPGDTIRIGERYL
jgi:polysaccharide biosynthesis/export protein